MGVEVNVLRFHSTDSIAVSQKLCYIDTMKWVIGIDEVGRGPLAGPVYVCAAAIPVNEYKKREWLGLNDSKKMSANAREQWFLGVELPIRYEVASRTAKMIDRKGIAVCIRECITETLEKLALSPKDCTVLLDGGLKAPIQYKNQTTIIKGDSKEKIISLASVIAKVKRDHYMITLHKKYPRYTWNKNKGYGTLVHRAAIKKWGLTSFHRISFLKNIISE